MHHRITNYKDISLFTSTAGDSRRMLHVQALSRAEFLVHVSRTQLLMQGDSVTLGRNDGLPATDRGASLFTKLCHLGAGCLGTVSLG